MEPFDRFFWLIAGTVACAGTVAMLAWRRRRYLERSGLTDEQLRRFAIGYVIWVSGSAVILWALQMEAGESVGPFIMLWPSPQRHAAQTLQVLLWLVSVWWVFFRGGAVLLAKLNDINDWNAGFMRSPVGVKVVTILGPAIFLFFQLFFGPDLVARLH